MLNIPNGIVQTYRVEGFRHLSNLIGVVKMLMEVPACNLTHQSCQFRNIVLYETMVSIEAEDVVVSAQVWRVPPSEEQRLLFQRGRHSVPHLIILGCLFHHFTT